MAKTNKTVKNGKDNRAAEIAALFDQAWEAFADGTKTAKHSDKRFREGAEILVRLRDEYGIKQVVTAKTRHLSTAAVNRYLKWADEGYKGRSPYQLDHETQRSKRRNLAAKSSRLSGRHKPPDDDQEDDDPDEPERMSDEQVAR